MLVVARIEYDADTAIAFRRSREVSRDGLADWREAIRRYLRPDVGMTIVDLGAGTGVFATAFADWFDVQVLAVEPSPAMRAQIPNHPKVTVLPGDAAAIPVADSSVDAVWLSTVLHHIPDLAAAAAEIRRVLRPGALVLIRGVFPGHLDGITLFRYFPEAARVVDTFPTVEQARVAFGLAPVALEELPQQTAPSLRDAAARIQQRADTLLRGLSDQEFARGLAQLQADAEQTGEPVVDWLTLLVLRHNVP
jgi:SAM-dependent methyltransferase